MLNLNKILLAGHIASDITTKEVNDKTVTEARLAVNDTLTKRADFVTLEIWNGRGEAFAKHLAKGRPVFIEGRLRIDTWKDQDGNNRSATKVIVDDWRFADNKAQDA